MSKSPVSAGKVPIFELYGENQPSLTPDLVHCESIAARSRLHNWEIRPHRHHGLFQLLWLEQGAADCQLDESRMALSGSSVLLVPQHCIHGFQFSTDARGLVVTAAYGLLSSLGAGIADDLLLLAAPRLCPLKEASAHVESSLRALQAEFEGEGRYRQAMINACLASAMGWLLRQQAPALAEGVPYVDRASQHVARFSALVDEDFQAHATLDHYAQKLGISSPHLNALCRQVTGRSALELVHARLMLEARRMLVYTSMTIGDVSEVLGFSDPAYFTRFFRRHAGLAPRDFRQKAEAWNGGGQRR